LKQILISCPFSTRDQHTQYSLGCYTFVGPLVIDYEKDNIIKLMERIKEVCNTVSTYIHSTSIKHLKALIHSSFLIFIHRSKHELSDSLLDWKNVPIEQFQAYSLIDNIMETMIENGVLAGNLIYRTGSCDDEIAMKLIKEYNVVVSNILNILQ